MKKTSGMAHKNKLVHINYLQCDQMVYFEVT